MTFAVALVSTITALAGAGWIGATVQRWIAARAQESELAARAKEHARTIAHEQRERNEQREDSARHELVSLARERSEEYRILADKYDRELRRNADLRAELAAANERLERIARTATQRPPADSDPSRRTDPDPDERTR